MAEQLAIDEPVAEQQVAEVDERSSLVDSGERRPDLVPLEQNRAEGQQRVRQERVRPEPMEVVEAPAPAVAETPEPSQIVRMTLAESVIRVIAIPEDIAANEVVCDIDINETLASPPPAPPAVRPTADAVEIGEDDTLKNVAKGLKLGDRHNVLFGSGIANVSVGLEVTIIARGKAVIAELRPKFALPSGDTTVFSLSGGSRKLRQISRQLELAAEAQAALPNLRAELGRVQSEYQAVAAHARSVAVVSNTIEAASATLSQQAAGERAKFLFRRGAALEQQIARAERLATTVPVLRQDLQAIERVSEYSERIRSLGLISVRFHHNGRTLPAEAR